MSAGTKATHTPGPWHRNIRAGGKYPVVFAGRNQHVAQVVQQADPAETEANIDLIAAAPELLAALQKIERGGVAVRIDAALNECPINPDVLQAIIDDARAAIAKATGETP